MKARHCKHYHTLARGLATSNRPSRRRVAMEGASPSTPCSRSLPPPLHRGRPHRRRSMSRRGDTDEERGGAGLGETVPRWQRRWSEKGWQSEVPRREGRARRTARREGCSLAATGGETSRRREAARRQHPRNRAEAAAAEERAIREVASKAAVGAAVGPRYPARGTDKNVGSTRGLWTTAASVDRRMPPAPRNPV